MRSIAERIAQSGSVLGKGIHILDLKRQVREIGTNHHRATAVVFTDFQQHLTAGRFQKDKLRTAVTFLPPNLLESENLAVEMESFIEIGDTVAGVKKFCNHGCKIGVLALRSQDDIFDDSCSDQLCHFFRNPFSTSAIARRF